MVSTSDGVGIVSRAVTPLMRYENKKNGVVSRVIRATESEESERFHFLPAPLMTPSLRSGYLAKTRLSESEAEAEGKSNHNTSSHDS